MSSDRPEQPLKWLINELPVYLTPAQVHEIMTGFAAVKRRYDLASKLRQAHGDLARYRRNQKLYDPGSDRYRTYVAMIDRRIERIKKLEQEISEL